MIERSKYYVFNEPFNYIRKFQCYLAILPEFPSLNNKSSLEIVKAYLFEIIGSQLSLHHILLQ